MTFAVTGVFNGSSIYLAGFGIARIDGPQMCHDINAQWNPSPDKAISFGSRDRALYVADLMRAWGQSDVVGVREL